jgi:hypothetical protein
MDDNNAKIDMESEVSSTTAASLAEIQDAENENAVGNSETSGNVTNPSGNSQQISDSHPLNVESENNSFETQGADTETLKSDSVVDNSGGDTHQARETEVMQSKSETSAAKVMNAALSHNVISEHGSSGGETHKVEMANTAEDKGTGEGGVKEAEVVNIPLQHTKLDWLLSQIPKKVKKYFLAFSIPFMFVIIIIIVVISISIILAECLSSSLSKQSSLLSSSSSLLSSLICNHPCCLCRIGRCHHNRHHLHHHHLHCHNLSDYHRRHCNPLQSQPLFSSSSSSSSS